MNINGVSHGPPPITLPSINPAAASISTAAPAAPVEPSTQVSLSGLGESAGTGQGPAPTGFAKVGVAAYNSIAA